MIGSVLYFYIFVEVLTKFIYSSPKFFQHPYNQYFELFIW